MLGWDSKEGGREVQLGKEVKYKGEEEAEEVVEVEGQILWNGHPMILYEISLIETFSIAQIHILS